MAERTVVLLKVNKSTIVDLVKRITEINEGEYINQMISNYNGKTVVVFGEIGLIEDDRE